MARFDVDHTRSAAMPNGIAKEVMYEFENSVYALVEAKEEGRQEGMSPEWLAEVEKLLNDEVAFWNKINDLAKALLEQAQPIYDALLQRHRDLRIAAFKRKPDGLEPDVPEAKTLGNVYTASRLDAILWSALVSLSDAAGLLGSEVPSWAIALASKRTQDPDFRSGNRNGPDQLRSESVAGPDSAFRSPFKT